jgi:hypothetical protein
MLAWCVDGGHVVHTLREVCLAAHPALHQTSKIMLEAAPVYHALQLPPTRHFAAPPPPPQPDADTALQPPSKPIYELRSYQLHPGYGSVPKLVETFAKG